MEKELPKIDLPEEWLVGTGISKELLGLYRNYPVRLKCEIFVLCTSGEVEASVNLNKITVEPNDFIVLTPGSIFQINDIKGDLLSLWNTIFSRILFWIRCTSHWGVPLSI